MSKKSPDQSKRKKGKELMISCVFSSLFFFVFCLSVFTLVLFACTRSMWIKHLFVRHLVLCMYPIKQNKRRIFYIWLICHWCRIFQILFLFLWPTVFHWTMSEMQTNTSTELAKDYITKRKIPQLFEVISYIDHWFFKIELFQALITGLMVHKPDDHIDFIVESLTQVNFRSRKRRIKR